MQYKKVGTSFLKSLQTLFIEKTPLSCLSCPCPEVFSARRQSQIKLFCGLSNYKDNGWRAIAFMFEQVKKMEDEYQQTMEL